MLAGPYFKEHSQWKRFSWYRTKQSSAVYSLHHDSFIYCCISFCFITSRQIYRKSSAEECIFDYMVSRFECRFNKNSLLQCYFLAILPAGYNSKNLYYTIAPKWNIFAKLELLTINIEFHLGLPHRNQTYWLACFSANVDLSKLMADQSANKTIRKSPLPIKSVRIQIPQDVDNNEMELQDR